MRSSTTADCDLVADLYTEDGTLPDAPPGADPRPRKRVRLRELTVEPVLARRRPICAPFRGVAQGLRRWAQIERCCAL